MARNKWEDGLTDLQEDNTSGSAELESRALNLLIDAVGDSQPTGTALRYQRWLLHMGRDLVSTQPAMAGMFRLVNDMLWAADNAVRAEEARLLALGFLQERQVQVADQMERVIARAANYLKRYERVMTYSRSSTVWQALSIQRQQKHEMRVYCSESRPMLEGQTLASELGWAGLEVVLGIDMALFGWLDEVQALIVGADAVSTSGVLNKIGTAALVHAAAERNIPRVVVATSQKFLPSDYVLEQGLRPGDPTELMPVPNKNVHIVNVYFDITPLEEISLVITEEGAWEHGAVVSQLEGLRTYPGLLGRPIA